MQVDASGLRLRRSPRGKTKQFQQVCPGRERKFLDRFRRVDVARNPHDRGTLSSQLSKIVRRRSDHHGLAPEGRNGCRSGDGTDRMTLRQLGKKVVLHCLTLSGGKPEVYGT